MKSIDKHIADLLYLHDCVIIPGLGGLVANPVPAVYDENVNMFYPPSKEIGFNINLKHNDGLLINHLTKTENISYDDAKNKINEYVETINRKLKNREIVSLGIVGELKKDNDGNILFSPNPLENFQSDSFGLTSFHLAPVIANRYHTVATYHSVKKAIRPFSTKHIAAAIALVAGLFLFGPDLKNPDIYQAGSIEFLMQPESIPNVNYIKTNTGTKGISENPGSDQNEVQHKIPKEKLNYFIITGSFKKLEKADKYCNQLRSEGFEKSSVLKSSKNRFRVAVEGFSTKKDALTALNSYRAQEDFKAAWLLRQR